MRNPRDQRKKGKAPTLPPGGGAAARAYQFALERGLVQREPEGTIAPRPRRKTSSKKPRRSK